MEQNLTREFEVGSRALAGEVDDGAEKLLDFLKKKKSELAAIDSRAESQLAVSKSLLRSCLAYESSIFSPLNFFPFLKIAKLYP